MTDHAYTALTHAQQRAGQLQQAIINARKALALAPADHPERHTIEAAVSSWEAQHTEEWKEIRRLQEVGE